MAEKRPIVLYDGQEEELRAEDTLPGPKVTVGTTAPQNPEVGDFWVDTN